MAYPVRARANAMAVRFLQSSLFALVLLLAGAAHAVVPQPVHVQPGTGRLALDQGAAISASDPGDLEVAAWLADLLERAHGVGTDASARAAIALVRVPRLS